MENDFNHSWAEAVSAGQESEAGEFVSPQLERMASTLYTESLRRPLDRSALKSAMEEILGFLCTPIGRTEVNCIALSWFLEVEIDRETWRDVPQELRVIIGQMGETMSVSDRTKLRAYGASPENLLAQLRERDTV